MSIHFAKLIGYVPMSWLLACILGQICTFFWLWDQTCNSTTSCASLPAPWYIQRHTEKSCTVSVHIQTACNTYCMMMLIQRIKQEIPASVHAFVHHSQKYRMVLMAKAWPHLLSHTKIRLECQCDTCLMGHLESRIWWKHYFLYLRLKLKSRSGQGQAK